jgi:hypothetical protein
MKLALLLAALALVAACEPKPPKPKVAVDVPHERSFT